MQILRFLFDILMIGIRSFGIATFIYGGGLKEYQREIQEQE